jgi:hypothetical protein
VIGESDVIEENAASKDEPHAEDPRTIHPGSLEPMMRSPQRLAILAVLALPITASAQHPAGRAAHPGGAAAHPGAMPQQRHPSQQHPAMSDFDVMMYRMQQEANLQDQQRAARQRAARSQATPNRQKSSGQQSVRPQQGMNTQAQPQPTGPKPRPQQADRKQSPPGAQKSDSQATAEKKSQHEGNPESDRARHDEAAASRKAEHDGRESVHKGKAKESINASRLPLAADQGIISLLRTSHTKLRGADHDYQGHRAQAMHHLTAALRHLGATSLLDSNVGLGLEDRPQAQSDRILHEAIIHLDTVEASLRSKGAAHHTQARTSVAEAIRELHIALNIR